MPQGTFTAAFSGQKLPASKPVIALVTALFLFTVYGTLGLLGVLLSSKVGFPKICDPKISSRQRFIYPVYIGVGLGVFFIAIDMVFKQFHTMGPLPHPPFPTSLVASITASIGEEVLYRLFFIPFWMWLISVFIFNGKRKNKIFWIVTLFSAFVFALGHLPSLIYAMKIESICQLSAVLIGELLLLNGILSILAAYYFKLYGFLAAIGIHFWTDIVWHVIWGWFSH